jgi:two-component sensor histidine kinase
MSAALTDISERKQMEDALRDREQELAQSVREKDVLVQEVHHRVKNNLQTIASLLSLHSGYTDNQHVVDALSEAGTRVQAIARLHEKLYASANLAEINFGDYLRSVGKELETLHNCPEITLDVVCDDIVFDIERATPLGLIANELILNSLKHAFPAGRAGHVAVSFEYVRDSVPAGESLDNGLVRLRVADNGIGLPSGLDIENLHSMGLELVRLLSGQLGATRELHTVNGVQWTITFPLRRVS